MLPLSIRTGQFSVEHRSSIRSFSSKKKKEKKKEIGQYRYLSNLSVCHPSLNTSFVFEKEISFEIASLVRQKVYSELKRFFFLHSTFRWLDPEARTAICCNYFYHYIVILFTYVN